MDVVSLVVGVLAEALDVSVSTEMPAARPDRLVLVTLDGGTSDGLILRPRVGLTCWGASDEEAHSIAMAAVDALWDAALDHPYLSSCELESLARDEWGRSGRARYVAALELTVNTDD